MERCSGATAAQLAGRRQRGGRSSKGERAGAAGGRQRQTGSNEGGSTLMRWR